MTNIDKNRWNKHKQGSSWFKRLYSGFKRRKQRWFVFFFFCWLMLTNLVQLHSELAHNFPPWKSPTIHLHVLCLLMVGS